MYFGKMYSKRATFLQNRANMAPSVALGDVVTSFCTSSVNVLTLFRLSAAMVELCHDFIFLEMIGR